MLQRIFVRTIYHKNDHKNDCKNAGKNNHVNASKNASNNNHQNDSKNDHNIAHYNGQMKYLKNFVQLGFSSKGVMTDKKFSTILIY